MVDCRCKEIDSTDMRLLLLRHAKAEKARGRMHDRDRPLNGRGRIDATEIAAFMVSRALTPQRVLVSSAERTRETWVHMAPEFSTAPAVDYVDRLYDAAPETIVGVIKAAGGNVATLMVIGHNPGMHDAARLLLAHRGGTAHQLDDGLPTAGLVVIDFAEDDWRRMAARSGRLKGFVTPRLIRLAKDND